MRVRWQARQPGTYHRCVRHLASLVALFFAACTCGSPSPTATSPTPPPMSPLGTGEVTETHEAIEHAAPPPRPERAATAHERAARVQTLSDTERTRLRDRARHLREGRRLAHDGDHASALAAFQAGLVLEPTDPTLLCEAGLQAHRTGDLELAEDLLTRGAAHAVRPATEGACLYNLGRVLEDRGDRLGAAEVYSRSVLVRPNDVVQARLDGLEATLDEEVSTWEEEEAWGVDLSVLEAGATFSSIDALCAVVGGTDCWPDTRYEAPTPTPMLRALQIVTIHSAEDFTDFGYLVAHGDRGVVVIDQILTSDSTDTYGRQEAGESVSAVQFEGSAFEVHIDGGFDEADGEGELYYRCESEHADDDDAAMACFDEGMAELGPPESWERTLRYRVDANGIVPE